MQRSWFTPLDIVLCMAFLLNVSCHDLKIPQLPPKVSRESRAVRRNLHGRMYSETYIHIIMGREQVQTDLQAILYP
jgi:hypothetical protein